MIAATVSRRRRPQAPYTWLDLGLLYLSLAGFFFTAFIALWHVAYLLTASTPEPTDWLDLSTMAMPALTVAWHYTQARILNRPAFVFWRWGQA